MKNIKIENKNIKIENKNIDILVSIFCMSRQTLNNRNDLIKKHKEKYFLDPCYIENKKKIYFINDLLKQLQD